MQKPTRFPRRPRQGLVAVFLILFTLTPMAQVYAAYTPPTVTSPSVFTDALQPKVDNTSGAFTLSVPIDLPPGRSGLQPNLSLNYNSQNTQNGNLGYGWNLSIPYIQRLNKIGSNNLYNANYFTSSLDGELVTTFSTTTTTISTTTPTTTIPTSNIAAYWKFDESSGNASDATGNGNTLVTSSGVTYTAGLIGNAASLSTLRWPRLFGQNFRFDKWNVCRG